MKRKITILLTLYKQPKSFFDNWDRIRSEAKEYGYDFIAMFDGNQNDWDRLNKYERPDWVMLREKNSSKFIVVMDLVKNYVKTSHFKSCDPDDLIYWPDFNQLENHLLSEDVTLISNGHYLKTQPVHYDNFISEVESSNTKVKGRRFILGTNATFVLPTKSIKNIDSNIYNGKYVNFGEDNLLSILSIKKIERSKLAPYIHLSKSGITSQPSKEKVLDFIDFTSVFANYFKFGQMVPNHKQLDTLYYNAWDTANQIEKLNDSSMHEIYKDIRKDILKSKTWVGARLKLFLWNTKRNRKKRLKQIEDFARKYSNFR